MPFGLDTVDREIVSLLLEDGRVSSAEITRRIGHVSERAVRIKRIRDMAKICASGYVEANEPSEKKEPANA